MFRSAHQGAIPFLGGRERTRASLLILGMAVGLGAGLTSLLIASRQGPAADERGTSTDRLADLAATHPDSHSVILRHDLGIVRPRQQLAHTFQIPNSSCTPWTLLRVHSTCACTVSQPSAATVAPGEEMKLEITYKASSKAEDDRRRVGVEFAEPAAPFFWLELRVLVRDSITLLPPELTFKRVGRGQVPEAAVEVQNYTDQDLQNLVLRTSHPWLTAQPLLIRSPGSTEGPRQVWRVLVRADTRGLPAGRHQAQVQILTEPEPAPQRVVPIDLYVTAPVEAIPAQLFFPPVPPGATGHQKVLLRFTPDVVPTTSDSIRFSHDLSDRLTLTCTQASAQAYELSATLLPARGDKEATIEGTVQISFAHKSLPVLTLPVYARAQKP